MRHALLIQGENGVFYSYYIRASLQRGEMKTTEQFRPTNIMHCCYNHHIREARSTEVVEHYVFPAYVFYVFWASYWHNLSYIYALL